MDASDPTNSPNPNDPPNSNDPPIKDVHTCDVDPPEEDVFLRLDCSSKGHKNCKKGTEGNKIATITNTIKTDNLPMYTLCRKGSTEYDLTVKIGWDVAAADGSGFGRGIGSVRGSKTYATGTMRNVGLSRHKAYDLHPKVSPPLVNFKYDDMSYNPTIARHSCKLQTNNVDHKWSATFYSFKFIKSDGRAIEDPEDGTVPGTGRAIHLISVEIPEGSRSTTFHLDPHRCPDNSTSDDYEVPTKSSSTISVGIKSLDQTAVPVAERVADFAHDTTSKSLKVKFSNGGLGVTDAVFKQAIKNALVEKTKKTLSDLQTENDVLFNNDIYDIVDKVAGQYGSAE